MDSDHARECECVARARLGQPGAYAELMDRYAGPVRRAVLRIVGDADRAGDVTQRAFIAAWENLDRYDPEHRFFSWVYRIAVNAALNDRRDRSRLLPLDGIDPPATGPDPEQRLLLQERRAALASGLAGLRPHHRLVLALHYDLGLSGPDIARILDLPPSTVKSRLHEALSRLRRDCLTQTPREP